MKNEEAKKDKSNKCQQERDKQNAANKQRKKLDMPDAGLTFLPVTAVMR